MNRLFRKKTSEASGLFADAQGGVEPEFAELKSGAPGRDARGSFMTRAQAKVTKVARPAKTGKASGIEARPAELVENDKQTAIMAFGLRWRTMVKAGGGRDAAQEMASKAKATHFFLRSHQIGYTQLPKAVETPVYPAALIAAKSHAGTGLFLLSLDSATYWLTLVRQGQPTNTDEILTGLSEATAVARARQLIAQFENEPITVFTDIRNAGFDGQRQFGLVDLFDTVKSDADRLVKVQTKKGSIPRPLMVGTTIAALLLGTNHLYKQYKAEEARKLAAQNQVAMLTPQEAWTPVYQAWVKERTGPNLHQLHDLRQQVVQLPVLWSGWTLAGTRCQSGALNSSAQPATKTWGCVATYVRPRVATTSLEMKQAVAIRYPNHAVSFPTLGSMQLSWNHTFEQQPLELAVFGDPTELSLLVSSEMQNHLPALAAAPDFAMQVIDLPQPKQQDGTPIPKPDDMPTLYKGQLTLRGPFRSMDVLASKLVQVEWEAVGLVVDTKAGPSQKSITSSSLMVELVGNVYGKK